jgi:hypothetical protein
MKTGWPTTGAPVSSTIVALTLPPGTAAPTVASKVPFAGHSVTSPGSSQLPPVPLELELELEEDELLLVLAWPPEPPPLPPPPPPQAALAKMAPEAPSAARKIMVGRRDEAEECIEVPFLCGRSADGSR